MIEKFWQEINGRSPLIEPVAGDGDHLRVTFVWRGDSETRSVGLIGGLPNEPAAKQLTRLADSDLWFLTERFPRDSRFTYALEVNAPRRQPTDLNDAVQLAKRFPPRADPLNPRSFFGMSAVELPDAPEQRWIERQPGSVRGMLDFPRIRSEILNEDRQLTVYVPPGGQAREAERGLLIVLDGQAYGSDPDARIPTPIILDNLVREGKIPALVAILIDNPSQAERNRDLTESTTFADFLANELVPWARARYQVSSDPAKVIVCGSSFGGLCAAYCGLKHPEAFGNVLSQSGSFFYYPGYLTELPTDSTAVETGWLTRQFVTSQTLPLRFFIEVGRFERGPVDNLAENRRMRDVLEAKGYPVTYSEYNGGHDYYCWRGSLADGLIALAGDWKRNGR